MSEAGRAPRRRPGHARPSLLAPTRSVTVVGGLLAAAALALAGCAAVAASAASNPRVAAHPSPVRPLAVAGGTFFAGAPGVASTAAQIATIAADPGWFLVDQHRPPPTRGTRVIAPRRRDSTPSSALATSGIPITALQAYRQAAAREAQRRPRCRLTWPLLGGIGRIESNHGRFAGAVLHSDGLSTPRVIGIPLNGNGTALILDTDNGVLDGDVLFDRAVGPMQFIPSTWAGWGVDANHDGVADPFNIFDAAAAAADYLCAAGRNLRTYAGQVQAVRSYNNSDSYISLVLGVERVYARGVGITVPIEPTNPDPGGVKPPRHHPHLPPVDPGHPPGLEHEPHPACVPAHTSVQHDHSASPSPSHTYDPSGPADPRPPKPCRTHSGSSTPPPGGGPHSSGSSSGSTSPPPASSSAPPTSPAPTSTAPDPGSPTETSSSDSAPSSDAGDSSADVQTGSPSGPDPSTA